MHIVEPRIQRPWHTHVNVRARLDEHAKAMARRIDYWERKGVRVEVIPADPLIGD